MGAFFYGRTRYLVQLTEAVQAVVLMFWPRLGGRFAAFTTGVWAIDSIKIKADCACVSIAFFRIDVPAVTLVAILETGLMSIAIPPD